MWGIKIPKKFKKLSKTKRRTQGENVEPKNPYQDPYICSIQYPYAYPYPTYNQPYNSSPTIKGLFIMLIASILIIVGIITIPMLALIGWVISGVGYLIIYNDRIYYSKVHQENMRYSLMLYLVGIPVFIIGVVSLIFYFLITMDSESSTNNFIYPTIFFIIIFLMILGSALMFMGRYKLLVGLIPPEKNYLLRFAVLFAFLVILIIIILVTLAINTNNFILILIFLFAFFTLIILSSLLFLYCFYIAYDFQKRTPQPYYYHYTTPPPVYYPPYRPYYYYPYSSYYQYFRPSYYYYY